MDTCREHHTTHHLDPQRSTVPSTESVAELAAALDRDGFEPHESAVSTVVGVARRVEPAGSSLDVIADRHAPEVSRARAFRQLSERWDDVRSEVDRRHARFDRSFDLLRFAASRHALIPRHPESIDLLWRSRVELDGLRVDVARRRREAFGDAVGLVATSRSGVTCV